MQHWNNLLPVLGEYDPPTKIQGRSLNSGWAFTPSPLHLFCQWAMLQKQQSFPHRPLCSLLARGSLQKELHEFFLLRVGGSVSGGHKAPPEALCPWKGSDMSSTGSSGQLAFPLLRPTRSCPGYYFYRVFCLKKVEQEPFLCQLQLWWILSRAAVCLHSTLPPSSPPDETSQSSLQRSSKTDW